MKKSIFYGMSTKEKIFWVMIGPVAIAIFEYAIYVASHANQYHL